MRLVGAPATELRDLVARREVSAVEVVEAHLRRIDAVADAVNAVVQVDAERARAQARDPVPGPLSGVPFTVKDNLAVAGLPMAIGVPERADVVPDADAVAVARLRAAGAILVGKTNCPPWGGGIESDNPLYGRTNNPYDLGRTPGGSSGGEAAAVAAGCSAFGLGTDSGASVRLPAHFCGLASLKPTARRVPVTGVLDDLGQIGALSDPRTQVGPLARSVADVALVLSVIAGPDGRDGGVAPVALGPPAGARGLRVALFADDGFATPTAETVSAVERAAEALREAGAMVVPAAPPAGGHALTVEVWRSYGDEMSAEGLYDVLRRWDAFRTETLRFGESFDVILSPVFPTPAPPHGELSAPGTVDRTSYTTPHNLTGWPAATVRCGTDPGGLPIAVQIAAHPWRDEIALGTALTLEAALGGYAPPGLP